SRPSQLLDDIAALDNTDFTDDELARIDAISARN
ncbi:MAG: NADP-dependent oxidoreductase, partial [Bifidobacterium criceti]|nr:NADP-dependent oxidoreductase [Bifidobacterium criceti]